MLKPSVPGSVQVESRELLQLYLNGEHDTLTASLCSVFDYLGHTTYLELNDDNRASIIQFVKVFLTIFTQPDYVIPEQYIAHFVSLNELISNLTAMTPFRNTDGFLELLRYQPSNLVKILTLYSARNIVRFDVRPFFDVQPILAAQWYCRFCNLYKSGLVRDDVCRHMAEHLNYRDERMPLTPDITEPYFGSTYVDESIDRHVKPFLNQVVRRSTQLYCNNRPNPRKIAIISDMWEPTHSVFRTLSGYVRSLKDRFHLTFFHCLRREHLDFSLFDEVHHLEFRDLSLDVGPLQTNDFAVVYFPDIGMTLPSIMLSNYRIAPIQICGTGHPVSTWGSEIDYFMSGVEVEDSDGQRNYSERLLLLPGNGRHPQSAELRADRPEEEHFRYHYQLPFFGSKTECPFSGDAP